MKITYAGYVLGDDTRADPDDFPIAGLTLNGQRVVNVEQIVRAAAVRIFARGNLQHTLQFQSTRTFASVAVAEHAALLTAQLLPKSGALSLICGAPGDGTIEVIAASSACTAVGVSFQGCSIVYTFAIVFASLSGGDDSTVLLEAPTTMIYRDRIALASGIESQAITYPTAFSAPPSVAITISKPTSADDNLLAELVEDLGDETGCTVVLTAPTPSTGYFLNIIAAGI